MSRFKDLPVGQSDEPYIVQPIRGPFARAAQYSEFPVFGTVPRCFEYYKHYADYVIRETSYQMWVKKKKSKTTYKSIWHYRRGINEKHRLTEARNIYRYIIGYSQTMIVLRSIRKFAYT